ncbi:MAG: periplasmic binding protein-related protein [Proteobacteria bacterium]|nr:periplasmic binding protein-related protein [Pseudomonadota bacterium]
MLAPWGRAIVLFMAAIVLLLEASIAVSSEAPITLGVVPQFEQRKLFSIWKPIVDELSRRTGIEIRLAVTLTVPEFEQALEKGAFDLVYANPYHILRVSESPGYIPLVRDQEPLHGILVVHRDSPVKTIKELAGKTLAIPSPNALGASLLLQADLERLYGVRMSTVNVRTHSSVYLNVLNGLVDAGGGVEKTLAEQNPAIRDGLRILYTTRDMPSHPVAAHPRLRPEIRERVRKAILEMAATTSGKALLNEVPMAIPVSTSLDDYLVMRKWGLESYWVSERK